MYNILSAVKVITLVPFFCFRIQNLTQLKEGYSIGQQALNQSFFITLITAALEVFATLKKNNSVTEKESPLKQLCSLKFK